MTNTEIKARLEQLGRATMRLEDMYIENGGEVTEETEAAEAQISALSALLTTEGVDSLGRWLKAKEDEKQAVKNEKAAIAAREKALDRTIGYIKSLVGRILRETGQDKVKGTLYSFAQAVASRTSVKTEDIERLYGEDVRLALEDVLPPYITVKLGASVSAVPDGMPLPEIFDVTKEETSRFTKPRAAKGE